jgi:hypothetical protein
MDPETGFMIPIATYYGARRVYEKLPGYEISWSGGKTEAPPDIPRCGFLNDAIECREPGKAVTKRSEISFQNENSNTRHSVKRKESRKVKGEINSEKVTFDAE